MTPKELESLPESIRDWNEATEAKDINSFWDGMKSMRSKIGTGLYQPSEEAGTEDWGKFSNKAIELSNGRLIPKPDLEDKDQRKALFKSLGVPDEVSGYEFETIEGFKGHDDIRKEFLTGIAKEFNLSKSQLKGLDKRIVEADLSAHKESQTAFNEELNDLKAEWGLATDDRIHSAKKVQKIFFPHIPEGVDLSASEIKSFYNLYKQLNTESKEFQDQDHKDSGGMSKDDAAMKISEIRNNKDHPYNNPRDPGYNAAKKMVRNLYLAKNGQNSE